MDNSTITGIGCIIATILVFGCGLILPLLLAQRKLLKMIDDDKIKRPDEYNGGKIMADNRERTFVTGAVIPISTFRAKQPQMDVFATTIPTDFMTSGAIMAGKTKELLGIGGTKELQSSKPRSKKIEQTRIDAMEVE